MAQGWLGLVPCPQARMRLSAEPASKGASMARAKPRSDSPKTDSRKPTPGSRKARPTPRRDRTVPTSGSAKTRPTSGGSRRGRPKPAPTRKPAYPATGKRQRLFEVVSEGSLAGVYVIQDGEFRYVNPALARILRYPREELEGGMGPADRAHPEDWPTGAEVISRREEGGVGRGRDTLRGR